MSCSLILIFIFIIISTCNNYTSIYSWEWKSAQQFARINPLMLWAIKCSSGFPSYVHLAVITAPESGNLPTLAGIKILKLNFVA